MGEVLLSGTCKGVGVIKVFLSNPSTSDSFFNSLPINGGFLFRPTKKILSWAGKSDLEKMATVLRPKYVDMDESFISIP